MFHLRSSTVSSTKANHEPSLFEVRLKSPYKNIFLIKGTEYEAPSVYLSGNLVFALPEKTNIKRIGLRLIGTFKLDFMEVLTHNNRISSSNPVKEMKTVLHCDWDNLLVKSEAVIKIGDYNNENTALSSTTSSHGGISGSGSTSSGDRNARSRLRRPGAPTMLELPEPSINKTPFQDVATPSDTFVLPEGNYELPFSCILPGDIPETIEGLQSGSIFYKFEAFLEKKSLSSILKNNNIIRYKYFRIFRTLAPHSISLNEEVSIENTWPGRVQYEVSIPRKLVPVGGVIPVKILIIPLKKKLQLGKISATIIQHYVLRDSHDELYDHNQIIYDSTLPQIPMSQLGVDRWDINASVVVPSDLKIVTQDCDLRNGLIKVRHKLKFRIQLINGEDGHVSELRAKLPIIVFISPHHKILARNIELDHVGKVHIKPGGISIFENCSSSRLQSPSLTPQDGDEVAHNNESDEDEDSELAPPVYEQHIYDELYDALTGATSPPTSPRPIIPRSIASPSPIATLDEPTSYFDLTPGSSTPTHDLLNQYLTNQRTISGRNAGVWSPSVAEDEFVTGHSGAQTPSLFDHQMSQLDLTALSKIPSYDELLNAGDESTDLAPLYQDSGDASENESSSSAMSPSKSLRPTLSKPHSTGHVVPLSAMSGMPSPSAKLSKRHPTGSQSYFDVTRNNSSSDLKQLGMTRPASVNNFGDLLHRRLLKKGVSHTKNEK